MITLYYIRGLTRLDEPVFDTLENQTTFFNDHKIKAIDTGFYPPHFKNVITLSTEDADFTKTSNYLSLLYNDKYYYYFIDGIEYVSEDVINLNITMDVIQTYMFNMMIEDCAIVRESIKRCTSDYTINRDYIRENVSQGRFVSKWYSSTYDDISWYIVWVRSAGDLVAKYIEDDGTLSSDYIDIPVENDITLTTNIDGGYNRKADAYITPIMIPVSNLTAYPNVTINGHKAYPEFSHLCEMPGVIRIVRIDANILKDYCTITKSGSTINITTKNFPSVFRVEYYLYWKEPIGTTDKYNYNAITMAIIPSTTMSLPYVEQDVYDTATTSAFPHMYKNTSTKTPFSYKYVPALLDENYIRVYFGEHMSYTTYPASRLGNLNDELYLTVMYDIISGSRIYGMGSKMSFGLVYDPWYSFAICNTQEYIDLYNDEWLNYYSSHQATWTMGYNLNKQQISYKFYSGEAQTLGNTIGSMMGGAMSNNAIVTLAEGNMFDGGSYSSYMGNTGRMIGTGIQGVTKGVGILADYFQNNYVLDQQREILKGDYEATPDTEKQGNNLSADTFTTATMRVFKVERVDDFENVAAIIERIGYKVAKRTYSVNLLKTQAYRYYYDCITANIYSMSLSHYMTDESTITNIKERFASGLRLWHTDSGKLRASYIGNYYYDNVEVDFIKEDN